MATVNDALRVAAGELHTKESPAGSNRTKYGKWYGLDGNPWCAMFVSWVLHQVGIPFVIQTSKGFAWTPAGVAWAKANKRWVGPNDLKPGDLIFFNFDNDAGPEHVGIVKARLAPGHYTTIEGNTSAGNNANGGEVQERDRHGSIILGGLRPPYAATKPTTPPVPTGKTGDGFRHPVLKEGVMNSAEVKHMQALLHRHGAVIVMDGDFGPNTTKKLKDFQLQRFGRRGTDGVCGPQSWSALHS